MVGFDFLPYPVLVPLPLFLLTVACSGLHLTKHLGALASLCGEVIGR